MYDYIIIGAGSAGCALAARLTEDPATNVLLLEAGGEDRKMEVRIPAAFGKLFKTAVDWAYETEPQAHLNDHPSFWPRGRMLGGSSSMNAMMYVRGHRSDYDGWAAEGADGWGYDDVLPYFKRSEKREGSASEYHGVDGPTNIAEPRSPNPTTRAFVDACEEAGIPRNHDINGATQDGVSLTPVYQKRGRRVSSADAFLRPALKRSNLTVRTNALATKVVFEDRRAVGVEFTVDRVQHEERAAREIILSGGSVNSPQLLMLSGVGPADQLSQFGIPVVADLPEVGENLQDHPAFATTYECPQPVTLATAESIPNLLRFLALGKGPLTSNVGEAAAFVRIDPNAQAPDLEIILAPVFFMQHAFENPEGHGITIASVLLRPKSRGSIRLRSTDPNEAPIIRANYFTEEADLQMLVEGVKRSREIARTNALAPYRGREVWPGEERQTDKEIADFIVDHFQSLYHPVGTCRMGNNESAVVDPELRVRGVQGLRVVDASVMPSIIGGHTNAPTVMIAERAADLIKAASYG